jgi:hypothetical protein
MMVLVRTLTAGIVLTGVYAGAAGLQIPPDRALAVALAVAVFGWMEAIDL